MLLPSSCGGSAAVSLTVSKSVKMIYKFAINNNLQLHVKISKRNICKYLLNQNSTKKLQIPDIV